MATEETPDELCDVLAGILEIATEALDRDVCKQLKEAVLKDSEEPELGLGE